MSYPVSMKTRLKLMANKRRLGTPDRAEALRKHGLIVDPLDSERHDMATYALFHSTERTSPVPIDADSLADELGAMGAGDRLFLIDWQQGEEPSFVAARAAVCEAVRRDPGFFRPYGFIAVDEAVSRGVHVDVDCDGTLAVERQILSSKATAADAQD